MNKRILLTIAALTGAAFGNDAFATTSLINGFEVTITNSQLSTAIPGATTFANSDTFANYSGSVTTPTATITGGALNPSGSTNPGSGIANANIANFVASEPGNPETITFNSDVNYFGLLWGSVDSDNTVTFYGSGSDTPIATFTGASLAVNGLQVYPANASYVDFTYTLGKFDKVVLSGSVEPFETSNLAAANLVAAAVPEPATWALMLVGFGMVGFAMRKRSSTKMATVNA